MNNRKRQRQVEMDADMEDIDLNEIVTDSEEEYTETEKKLLQKARTKRTTENYDSEDEVYALHDEDDEVDDEMEDEDGGDEEDGDSMESDIEGLQEDFDLPNERAWGKKKGDYFSTDYVDQDYSSVSQKELVVAEMEEQEARNIQKRLAEQLDDADFGLEFVQPQRDEEDKAQEETEEVVKTDLSKLSKRQKQAIMEKESPEFMALVNDFKERMTEAKDVLAPFLGLLDSGTIPDCPAVSFVKTKYHLSLNYCVNISFYLMLKAKRLPVNSHPVIKRLAQYRQLLNQLESGQEKLMDEIRVILKAKSEGKPLYNVFDGSKLSVKKTKELSSLVKQKSKKAKKEIVAPVVQSASEQSEEDEESVIESQNEEEEDEEGELKDEVGEGEEGNVAIEDQSAENEGKRAITYQMAKNKGLTPHRKKEQRNPRVKHRNKYRKAKIRRKGAVREVRKEISRYGGEISGIKASVKKSIKLK